MLTTQEIVKLAPAAGATKPMAHCSKSYSFVNTLEAIAALRKDGYVPVEARQDHVAPDQWGSHKHCRHVVRLRIRGTESLDRKAMMGGVVPELLLYNASNGASPFELRAGMYRQVCSNGLIAMVDTARMRTVHKYKSAEEIIEEARLISAQSKPLFDKIKRWTTLLLNDTAQKRFAQQALEVRLGDAERAKMYDALSIITPQRIEDERPTLWNLFNRAQENGMRGQFAAIENAGRGVAARSIRAIPAELRFNTELWSLAERWEALAAK